MADERPTPFKKGTRVVATSDLKGVPEGTAGTIGVGAGLVIPRYWVQFENGVEMGTVLHRQLVRAKEWPAFQAERAQAAVAEAERAARAAERAKAAQATAAASDGDGDGDASGDASGDAAAAEATDKQASPADDRLAALTARSKAARASKEE